MSLPGAPSERLAELRARGGERFDPAALRMVEVLLARGAALEPGAAVRLEARASARLDALDRRFEETRLRAEAELSRLRDLGHDPRGELARAYAGGDFARVLRAARRHPETEPRPRARVEAELRARLEGAAEARGLTSPGAVASPDGSSPEPTELAALLYRDAAARAAARITLARALEGIPEDAGRYHGGTVAARAVAMMAERYPTYLHAQRARLEALASLAAFAGPAAPSPEGDEARESDPDDALDPDG